MDKARKLREALNHFKKVGKTAYVEWLSPASGLSKGEIVVLVSENPHLFGVMLTKTGKTTISSKAADGVPAVGDKFLLNNEELWDILATIDEKVFVIRKVGKEPTGLAYKSDDYNTECISVVSIWKVVEMVSTGQIVNY